MNTQFWVHERARKTILHVRKSVHTDTKFINLSVAIQSFGFYPQSRVYFADFAVGPTLGIDKFGIKDLQFGRVAQFHE